MTETDTHRLSPPTHSVCYTSCYTISIILSLDMSVLHPQLLPVSAPGGRRGLEDQTELLGVAAARGKTDTHAYNYY